MALTATAISLIIAGASAGGQIGLSYLFRPRIKQTPTDVGKYDDIRVTGSDLGAFIPRVWGKGRFGGQIVVSTGVDHTIINSPSTGGKGGSPSAPATRTHVYKTSLAVLMSRGVIQQILNVWADADIIINNGQIASEVFFEAESATLAGGAAAVADGTASNGFYVGGLGAGGTATFSPAAIQIPFDPPNPTVPVPYTRISFFYKTATASEATVTLDGAATVALPLLATDTNWSVATITVSGHPATIMYSRAGVAAPNLDKIGVYYFFRNERFPDTEYLVSGIANPSILYPPNLDDPSEYYNYKPVKDAGTGTTSITMSLPSELIRFYTGTETQTQDSKIVSWLDGVHGAGQGVLRASAMRGMSYVMFQDYTLKQGRVPNFTFEVDSGQNTVNAVLTDLFTDINLIASDYDLTATTGLSQQGFLEHTQTSRRSLTEMLGRYHQFRIADIDGKIKTVSEVASSLLTVGGADLRAHFDTEEMPAFGAEILIKEETLLPREVRVSVMNREVLYHNEAQTAQLFGSTSATESKEYTFPIVDTPAIARKKAEILLLKEHAENKAFEFYGMPKLAKYSVGDHLTIPLKGINYTVRIEKKQSVLPHGKVKFQAVSVEPAIFTAPLSKVNVAPRVASEMSAVVNYPRNSVVFVIQSLPIVEKDKGRLGVYLAISGRGRGNWENCGLYREMAADNYILQQIIDSPSPLGVCPVALAAHPSNPDTTTLDATNTLTIYFYDDIELESVLQTDIDRHANLNLIRVGSEWLQFRTATAQTLPLGSIYRSKWQISNLWRGRFQTDGANASHNANEYAAIVTPALRFIELEQLDIGQTVKLKAVTNGQTIENAPVASFTFAPISTYNVANRSADLRTFDTNATTLDELSDVVATIITDTRF